MLINHVPTLSRVILRILDPDGDRYCVPSLHGSSYCCLMESRVPSAGLLGYFQRREDIGPKSRIRLRVCLE